VAAVHDLEEGDLGISREIYVLRAIGYQLHKAPTGHVVIHVIEKKNLELCKNPPKLAKLTKSARISREVF
jgi:hypothetical protein